MNQPPINVNNNLDYAGMSEYVNELYDKLSYYDMYGSTIMVFILITLLYLRLLSNYACPRRSRQRLAKSAL